MENPLQFFAGISDPRVARTKVHRLKDIFFITFAAVICGAESWYDIELFGRMKIVWLSKYIDAKHGIPSHDTFNRLFASIDPEAVSACFVEWTKGIAQLTQGEIISIDGKTLRGATDTKGCKRIVHMVSAWAGTNNIVLAQRRVDEKSNEITAIPALLSILEITGTIITIDAMGCQKNIVQFIMAKKANYIIALKGNQKELYEQVKDSFRLLPIDSVAEQNDVGHGRVEKRICSVIHSDLTMIEQREHWIGLKSIVKISSERYIKATQERQQETRYYISSLITDANQINQNVRDHWKIENSLHWSLDVTFHEDLDRKRAGNSAENFSVINRMALNVLKNETSTKASIKGKRLKAAWNTEYLETVLKI